MPISRNDFELEGPTALEERCDATDVSHASEQPTNTALPPPGNICTPSLPPPMFVASFPPSFSIPLLYVSLSLSLPFFFYSLIFLIYKTKTNLIHFFYTSPASPLINCPLQEVFGVKICLFHFSPRLMRCKSDGILCGLQRAGYRRRPFIIIFSAISIFIMRGTRIIERTRAYSSFFVLNRDTGLAKPLFGVRLIEACIHTTIINSVVVY